MSKYRQGGHIGSHEEDKLGSGKSKLGSNFVSIFYLQAQMPDPKTYKMHFESKHSKLPLPEELKDI